MARVTDQVAVTLPNGYRLEFPSEYMEYYDTMFGWLNLDELVDTVAVPRTCLNGGWLTFLQVITAG